VSKLQTSRNTAVRDISELRRSVQDNSTNVQHLKDSEFSAKSNCKHSLSDLRNEFQEQVNVSTADLVSTQTYETAVKSIEGKYKTLQRTQQDTGELFTKTFNVLRQIWAQNLIVCATAWKPQYTKPCLVQHMFFTAINSFTKHPYTTLVLNKYIVHQCKVYLTLHSQIAMNEIMDNYCNVINKYVDNLESSRNQQG